VADSPFKLLTLRRYWAPEYEQVVKTKLERSCCFKAEARSPEQRNRFSRIEAEVLMQLHPIRQPQCLLKVDDAIDDRRRHGDDHATSWSEEPVAGGRELWLRVERDVLQHRQSNNGVKRLWITDVLGKIPRDQLEAAVNGCRSGLRVDAEAAAYP
jgi:hypothetical protein